ncbi:MAG: DNA adenine methylase [Anaerorhabdus sp.]|uniref:DNA adenine methylase n=1 Tax=Anaerorhabdus sp. TaxID=1872524 RepID=UPI003A856D93
MKYIYDKRLSPLLKYPGGKEKELEQILPRLPENINRYYEPFVGGGAVFLAINCKEYLINDKSKELISLYEFVKENNKVFLKTLKDFDHNWNVMTAVIENHNEELIQLYFNYKKENLSKLELKNEVEKFVKQNEIEFNGMLQPCFNVKIENFVEELNKSISNKMIRMALIENKKRNLDLNDITKNIEGSFKNAFYMHFRYLYNKSIQLINDGEITKEYATAIYVFIRQYCYSSMFRYNNMGKFNVPYGGISYNRKSLLKNIKNYEDVRTIKHLDKTIIGNEDFYTFMERHKPLKNDFLFIDPPYDTEFSTYDRNEFNKNDQMRLANYLINECKANFMVVIKNTEFIRNLYKEGIKTKNGGILKVNIFDKKYMVSFQDRNNKNAEHLIITNYE